MLLLYFNNVALWLRVQRPACLGLSVELASTSTSLNRLTLIVTSPGPRGSEEVCDVALILAPREDFRNVKPRTGAASPAQP